MPKAKAQKRYRGSTSPAKTTTAQSRQRNASTPLSVTLAPQQDEQTQQILQAKAQARSVMARKNRSGSTQALVMAGMVAVGCWGLAFTFIFLTTTQNHVLIGGMIAVMALMWSFSFAMRIRKARAMRA